MPIKIVVYDNGKLGFVDIEQKAAGLLPVYTDLKNPDFGDVGEGSGPLGTQRLESRRTRGVRPELALPTRSSAAASESQTHAAGDATLAPRCARGRGRDGGLQRQGTCCTERATMCGK